MLLFIRKKRCFPPYVIDAGLSRSEEDTEGYLFVNTCSYGLQAIYMESRNAEFESTLKTRQDIARRGVSVGSQGQKTELKWTLEKWAA